MSSDPYVDPDTGVLRNQLGITDADQLVRAEANITEKRLALLADEGLPGAYDLAHLQAMHRHLFDGIYERAGELRTVNIEKATPFTPVTMIPAYANEVFAELARDLPAIRAGDNALSDRLAHHLGNLNALHPFREGNGRAQRLFISQLAGDSGHQLRWDKVDRGRNNAASIASVLGDERPLRAMIADILTHDDRHVPAVDEALRHHFRTTGQTTNPGRAHDKDRPGPAAHRRDRGPGDRGGELER